MTDAITPIAEAMTTLLGLGIAAFAGLHAWRGWLELKRLELGGRGGSMAGDRIELADLKERIRKLEAIAACVDL